MPLETDWFTPVSNFHIPTASRLLLSAWCPTMDLLVLVSRIADKDRLGLWRMHGVKVWEVEVSKGESPSEEITSVAWSPDGSLILNELDCDLQTDTRNSSQ